ncbi:MAG: hypothetical protein PVG47_06495 [Chromatiales bacterium]|jgi:hypothetical protein
MDNPKEEKISSQEWKEHFQSLDTEILISLLASKSLLHRDMVKNIVISRGISEEEIHNTIKKEKSVIAKNVKEAIDSGHAWKGTRVEPAFYAWTYMINFVLIFLVADIAFSIFVGWKHGLLIGLGAFVVVLLIILILAILLGGVFLKMAVKKSNM